ncbi:MAG: hypothetical protein GY729_19875 [Desulfobacteraceae bacterium]|nr:hypothetical protein [Desulfobacteraceae bacterium]
MKMLKTKITIILFLIVLLCPMGMGVMIAGNFKGAGSDEKTLKEKFNESLIEVLPMSSDQIRTLKKRISGTEKAMRNVPPPKITSKTKRLSLSPGTTTCVVSLVAGYVSSLVFYDVTGASWPVTSVTNGNQNHFAVTRPQVLPGNLLTVSALTEHGDTNLVITLEGHDIPVIIQLKTIDRVLGKESRTDALIAFQVEHRGPYAKDPVFDDPIETSIDDIMLSFVDGVPPAGATKVDLAPAKQGINVWSYDTYLYCRSRYSLVWPAWNQEASSAGGDFKVYRLPKVPSIMFSINGQYITLDI